MWVSVEANVPGFEGGGVCSEVHSSSMKGDCHSSLDIKYPGSVSVDEGKVGGKLELIQEAVPYLTEPASSSSID